ncbi:MATE family efflux transporter [Pseudomaricurvus alcaniphilus]|nr:MATE family efflux transporter [Pseudomaricurvus alcaniphilus]
MMYFNAYIRKNLTLAWPLALNAVLVQSMLMIDTLLVAPLGELSVAALGIATTIVAFVLGVGIAIGNGIQLLVGRAYGANSQPDLAVTYRVGLFISTAAALLFLSVLTFFGAELVAAITDDAELAALAESYLSITKYVVLVTAYTQTCTALLNGCGNSKVPLQGFLIELPVNAVLSYFLINGFGAYEGLGLQGAAWGSLIAVLLRAVYFYVVLKSADNVDLTYPQQRLFRAEVGPQYAEIYPVAANFFVLSIGATVYQLLFAQLDLFAFVAITLIFPWVRAGTQFTNAWAQASAISISQALGQKEHKSLALFASDSTRVAMTLSMMIAGLFLLLSQCIQFIYPNIEPGARMALNTIAPLYIILPIIRSYNSVSGNILRALGDSKRVLKIHIVTQWGISLPLCAILILHFDVSIFWAFAMMPLEELLKTIPFYRYKQINLKRMEGSVGQLKEQWD